MIVEETHLGDKHYDDPKNVGVIIEAETDEELLFIKAMIKKFENNNVTISEAVEYITHYNNS
jgi:hypothetical protein